MTLLSLVPNSIRADARHAVVVAFCGHGQGAAKRVAFVVELVDDRNGLKAIAGTSNESWGAAWDLERARRGRLESAPICTDSRLGEIRAFALSSRAELHQSARLVSAVPIERLETQEVRPAERPKLAILGRLITVSITSATCGEGQREKRQVFHGRMLSAPVAGSNAERVSSRTRKRHARQHSHAMAECQLRG